MNRSKNIYFLSALVLIIGCAALNLSYSLFIQTEQKDIVNSVVPNLNSTLSIESIILDKNEEILLKESVTNNSTISINYTLDYNGEDVDIKLVDKENNILSGVLDGNETNDIYLYLKNNSEEQNTITFVLNENYSTLNYDYVSNISDDDKYQVSEYGELYSKNIDSLNYKFVNSFIKDKEFIEDKILTGEEIENLFKTNNYIYLPLYDNSIIEEENDFSKTIIDTNGLYKLEDDYGVSYYDRGNLDNNYVRFANKLWRIVRINGDNSIRLVLNDIISSTPYSNDKNLGYMYNILDENSLETDSELDNKINSLVKTSLDKWYEENLVDYSNYLSDTLFCGDKSNDSYNRLYYLENSNINPTLECSKDSNYSYSRYTVNDNKTLKGIETNGNLDYPIGLLSADEVVLAGLINNGICKDDNNLNYLYSNTTSWTMTVASITDSEMFTISSENCLGKSSVGNNVGLRPVINLKGNLVVSGDGTKDNPYVVK